MKHKQHEELIAKYLSGNIESPEKKHLLSWAEESDDNKKFFDEMTQLWADVEEDEVEFETDMDSAWQNIAAKTLPGQKEEHLHETIVRPIQRRSMFLRIAAAVLFLVVATYWFTNQSSVTAELIVLQTGAEENKQVDLPDGTTVWLNQNSQLSYAEPFESRNVTLEGEAFFDVERMEESPFTITSGEAETRVLGTSFNVRAYKDEAEITVTVATGKVQFATNEKEDVSLILRKGDAGVLVKKENLMEKVAVEDKNVLSWKTKSLNFEEIQMEEVVNSLERHFDVEIEVRNETINNCTFHGVYTNPQIEDLIEMMEYSLQVEIKKEGNVYIFEGEGCELK